MERLARPMGTMQAHYDVVVVGSGYGGAIAACRLARAGRSVCVLERGRELHPGEYPEHLVDASLHTQTHVAGKHLGPRTGLFDFHLGQDISVVVGCGLGGTSLINANVALEADPRIFDDERWPRALRGGTDQLLRAGYDAARTMLGSQPYPDDAPPLRKLTAFARSGEALDHPMTRPPINVTFEAGTNAAGVHQAACTGCGNCVTGCNDGAKNTVLMNYLPDAHAHGAEIFTETEVWTVESAPGTGWRISFHGRGEGREVFGAPSQFVTADVVVLAAGTLGSTEILLRSARAGLSVSPRLGTRFSGNGDVIGFAYDADTDVNGVGTTDHTPLSESSPGPCIAGLIDLRDAPNVDDGLVIEDAVLPSTLAGVLSVGLTVADAALGEGPSRTRSVVDGILGLPRGPRQGALGRTQSYMVMSSDDDHGRLVLDGDRISVDWPHVGQRPVYRHDNDELKRAAEAVNAAWLPNPFWTQAFGDALITVHPLGGCVMADDATGGVVDDRGGVFSGTAGTATHDGLYVADGSIVPRPLGVNPLLTISALAERTCALLIEERGWHGSQHPTAPEPAPVTPGLRFTERMQGYFSTKVRTADAYAAGFRQGRADASPFEFVVTVDVDDVDQLVLDASKPVRLSGTVVAPALAPGRMAIVGGAFTLFDPDLDQVETSLMRYHLPLVTEDGRRFLVEGHKTLRHGSPLKAWGATTTLAITVLDDGGTCLGVGQLHIRPSDFLRQLSTMRIPRAGGRRAEHARSQSSPGGSRVEVIVAYGGLAAESSAFDEVAAPHRGRPVRLPTPEVMYCHRGANNWDDAFDDDVFLRLTRYRGGEQGPVVLAPGFGMSTAAFVTDTIDTNLTEYLVEHDYDVWLLDFRWSPDLPTSRIRFDIDDIATVDWPTALDEIRRRSGAASVQVIAHCVGSMSFLMAMLAGMEGVRSAVCSQVTTHPVMTRFNLAKTVLPTGRFLQGLGLRTIQPDLERTLGDAALDVVLRLVPTKREERCGSAVCRWITAFYGPTHRHAQLNQATHDDLGRLFGVADLDALNHISLICSTGHAVDRQGRDVYLPNVERLAVPILFLAGDHNRIFLPDTSAAHHAVATRSQRSWAVRAPGHSGLRAPRRLHRPGCGAGCLPGDAGTSRCASEPVIRIDRWMIVSSVRWRSRITRATSDENARHGAGLLAMTRSTWLANPPEWPPGIGLGTTS